MSKLLQDINLGKNIQCIRKSKKLTQKEVCAQMAILGRPMLQSTYAQIETGARNIFISDLIVLKTVLRTSYDEIFRDLVPINKYKE